MTHHDPKMESCDECGAELDPLDTRSFKTVYNNLTGSDLLVCQYCVADGINPEWEVARG